MIQIGNEIISRFCIVELGKLILGLGFVIFFFSCIKPRKILASSLVGMYLLSLLSVMLLHVMGNLEKKNIVSIRAVTGVH